MPNWRGPRSPSASAKRYRSRAASRRWARKSVMASDLSGGLRVSSIHDTRVVLVARSGVPEYKVFTQVAILRPAQNVTIRRIFDHALGSLIAALVWSRRPDAAR